MAGETGPFVVQAVYSFKGKNNDELCFTKGDVITVTQKEDGGWWEGTLSGKTGWFPSNYVKEHNASDPGSSEQKDLLGKLPQEYTAQQKVYRNLVLKDIIDSETAHVTELHNLLSNFLHPLEKSEILSTSEYEQLVGNFADVVDIHRALLRSLEDCYENKAHEQRIGRSFLSTAPQVKAVHLIYCANHPRAVCMLEKYKDELNGFMEGEGAHSPGIMVLTTGLSKPFRRLEKYAGMLQELERHMEESHVDRGDTQRSIFVYKDIASACSAMRRQKEMELEVLTGTIRGWEGEELCKLGDTIHMGSVAVGAEHCDRYFVLFPCTLLMLSVSPRMSAFIYEGKLPLSGVNVNKLEDSEMYKNAFEIIGPMIDRIVAVCQTKDDQQKWVDLLKQQIRASRISAVLPSKPQPIPPPHVSATPPLVVPPHPIHSNVSLTMTQSVGAKTPLQPPNKVWRLSCLRPSPPLRPCLALGKDDNQRKHGRSPRKKDEHSFEDDAHILSVIEAYCTSAKTRYTVNSALLDSPQVLIAEEEKIIIEETSGTQTIVEEKSLVDTVYALKDQVKDLQRETVLLSKGLEEERRWRKRMEVNIKTQLCSDRDDIQWED